MRKTVSKTSKKVDVKVGVSEETLLEIDNIATEAFDYELVRKEHYSIEKKAEKNRNEKIVELEVLFKTSGVGENRVINRKRGDIAYSITMGESDGKSRPFVKHDVLLDDYDSGEISRSEMLSILKKLSKSAVVDTLTENGSGKYLGSTTPKKFSISVK